jgi:hypothetical protein
VRYGARPAVLAALSLSALLIGTAQAQTSCDPDVAAPGAAVLTPLVFTVVADPVVPARGTDGRLHLAYEFQVANVTDTTARLAALDVVDPSSDGPARLLRMERVEAIDGADVSGKVRLYAKPGTMTGTAYSTDVPAAQGGYLYLDVTFAPNAAIPCLIAHRVTVIQPDRQSAPSITTLVGVVRVSPEPAVSIGPPLRGDRWFDGSGCCSIIGPHRYTILPIDGRPRAPEHFAIDFVQLDPNGRLFTGDGSHVADWSYYGADLVAVAAGTVVAAVDGLPDQPPGHLPTDATVATAAGNHVIMDLGHGHFALYAHLLPGSVAVAAGDKLARGQRLGRLGNSGNTDSPHLHFQIMDRPSALAADGLPFVFDAMTLRGRLPGTFQAIDQATLAGRPVTVETAPGDGRRAGEMPLTLDVVDFP